MFANGAGFSRAVLLCAGGNSKSEFRFSEDDHADRGATTTIG
jgi:hypothetical protein